MNNNFEILEKIVLSILLVCTLIAIGQEILVMVENKRVSLADILLLFIYVEVLGMIKEYWLAKVIRMSYPLFIAMTALARLIILQRKDIEPVTLIYESLSILIIAISIVVLRVRHLDYFKRDKKD
jgi:protein PsiE|tara:strand:+ start:109 stop:483 length:375 start_codon:yes stop_codon:yes gene_type:complete